MKTERQGENEIYRPKFPNAPLISTGVHLAPSVLFQTSLKKYLNADASVSPQAYGPQLLPSV